MTSASDLEFLLEEAEEALEVEGFLMLYESLLVPARSQRRVVAERSRGVVHRGLPDNDLHHHLHLAWISWPQKEVVGDATGAELSFEIDDAKDVDSPILALVPAEMLGEALPRLPT